AVATAAVTAAAAAEADVGRVRRHHFQRVGPVSGGVVQRARLHGRRRSRDRLQEIGLRRRARRTARDRQRRRPAEWKRLRDEARGGPVKTIWIYSLTFGIAISAASTARAQSVADVLTFLVTNRSVETGSIDRDRSAAQATSDTISRALRINLATLPVTTSSGGFVYRLNPELGTVERARETFGPFFVERALTAGLHQASFGLTFQHVRFNSLDGANLRDGSLVTTANQFVDEQTPFDVDALALNIDADIATFYGNVGITKRMEIGFAAPMVALRLSGSRVNTYRGRQFTQASARATAVGLADLVVRTKYTVYDEDGAGVAAAVDVRLPTGHEEDLLGSGSTSVKFAAIGSLERGHTSGHANVGISVGGLARELSYGGALALAATPRVTVTGELL